MKMNTYEQEHLQRLHSFLPECTVLLKGNGDFPLEKPGKIALYGNGVRNTVKGGTGSGEVNSRFFETVEEGFQKAGFTITSGEWLECYDRMYETAKEAFYQEIRESARKKQVHPMVEGMGAVMPEPEYSFPLTAEGDTAIYVLSRISGEGSDRREVKGDILLTESEEAMIKELNRRYPKFMLVLNTGGPIDLSPVLEVENILLLSQLGVETGGILAELVLGKANPSGKLTTTWARCGDYPEIMQFGEWSETRYQEGIYVGYRYFDTVEKKVLFPFGHGGSYTKFEISAELEAVNGLEASVAVTVKNKGSFAGKEVVQVYVSVPEGRLDQPYQVLADWEKTKELQPGEVQTMQIVLSLAELASYDTEQAAQILEKGAYILRVGNSSRKTRVCGVVELKENLVLTKKKNCLGEPDFADWKPETGRRDRKTENREVPRYEADCGSVRTKTVSYQLEEEPFEGIGQFDESDLIGFSVGRYEQAGGEHIVGDASLTVAGAAGETSSRKGVPSLVMADGPAGLRLCQKYFKDETGVHSIGQTMPESMQALLSAEELAYMESIAPKPKPDSQIYEQYTTALPIGTAIAQSWNTELARVCGNIVGAEMKRFGIHLWLAPALNIHRSVRCGRNYEYFSEDPLISGAFAAALTEGVQQHPGCGVTIKHFAANNQETNRYNNNSLVSERAMREIYLKGFEICVRQAAPKAVMTSYNLLNGIHTSEHRALLEDVLRCEFGFRGVVMTDWVITSMTMGETSDYPQPEAYKVALAGNDIFMPGSPAETENLRKARQEGLLPDVRLQRNVSRICRLAQELAGIQD